MADTVIQITIPTSSEVNTGDAEHIAEILTGIAAVVVPDLIPSPNTLSGSVTGGVMEGGRSGE